MVLKLDIIEAAILGLESQKQAIDGQISELRQILDGNTRPQTSATSATVAPRRHRKFSAAAIQRMREAQKRRWAKVHGEAKPAKPAAAPIKPRRKLSAAARAKLVANLKRARAAKAAKARAAGAR